MKNPLILLCLLICLLFPWLSGAQNLAVTSNPDQVFILVGVTNVQMGPILITNAAALLSFGQQLGAITNLDGTPTFPRGYFTNGVFTIYASMRNTNGTMVPDKILLGSFPGYYEKPPIAPK